ncbi:MAG: TadE family protein [Myxococcota bacterium]
MRRPTRARRGSSTLEFALIVPVWCVLVFATLEYGWCAFVQSTLERAVSAGARRGAMVGPYEDAEVVARARATQVWSQTGLGHDPRFEGRTVGATGTFEFDGRVPYVPLVGIRILPTPSELRARTQRLREAP